MKMDMLDFIETEAGRKEMLERLAKAGTALAQAARETDLNEDRTFRICVDIALISALLGITTDTRRVEILSSLKFVQWEKELEKREKPITQPRIPTDSGDLDIEQIEVE